MFLGFLLRNICLFLVVFSQERWDHIWYGILGSPAFYCWRGLDRIHICWVVTDGPRYLGYRTLTHPSDICQDFSDICQTS
jgi:hypothetical protein